MSAQVAADLRAAADVLERDGWTQGRMHRYVGDQLCHCASGAIAVATGAHIGFTRSESADGYERENGGLPSHNRWDDASWFLAQQVSGVESFNDAPRRTADEVIAALRAAADRAEAQGQPGPKDTP